MSFLDRVLNHDESLIEFLRLAVGYSLTGDISEQCLFFLYGTGKNGKSTFIETIMALMDQYGLKTPVETLMSKQAEGIRNDLARLAGSRLVAASETEEGRRLNETLVKDLTGGDTITARFLHKEFFEIRPTWKIWIYGNHKPEIRGTDEGIWRRMRLIPFTVKIPDSEQDPQLPARLKEELPGILAWAVRGCLDWQQAGRLPVPAVVQSATASYRYEMDMIGTWLAEHCLVSPNVVASAKALYTSYTAWCTASGERSVSQRRFGESLTERGFARQRQNQGIFWKGIGLLAGEELQE
jgi:putative DNA primase/helicase